MLKNVLFVVVSLFTFAASATQVEDAVAAAMGRSLTAEEMQTVQNMEYTLAVAENGPIAQLTAVDQPAPEAFRDLRTDETWMGCLTVKGGLVLVSTQKLVCTNLFEVYTITKSVGLGNSGNFSLSADAGLVLAHMGVNPNTTARLQAFELVSEPVDTIGFDASALLGAQVVLFSSPNVSLQLYGVIVGGGAGLTVEQNGNIPRDEFEGSTLNIKKFNF
jgi:hypothetical protein